MEMFTVVLLLSHSYLYLNIKLSTLFHKHQVRVSVDDRMLVIDVSHSDL